MGRIKKRCRNCRRLFVSNPKNIKSQVYCSKVECQKASKKASQKRWLSNPENLDYFRCPGNLERLQGWWKKNQRNWKQTKKGYTLQNLICAEPAENTKNNNNFADYALQDGIPSTRLRMKKYGQDILYSQPEFEGDTSDCKRTNCEVPYP